MVTAGPRELWLEVTNVRLESTGGLGELDLWVQLKGDSADRASDRWWKVKKPGTGTPDNISKIVVDTFKRAEDALKEKRIVHARVGSAVTQAELEVLAKALEKLAKDLEAATENAPGIRTPTPAWVRSVAAEMGELGVDAVRVQFAETPAR